MCSASETDWYFKLPAVLFGLRTRVRLDAGVSPAEMVFGQSLRIPGDFLAYDQVELEPEFFTN